MIQEVGTEEKKEDYSFNRCAKCGILAVNLILYKGKMICRECRRDIKWKNIRKKLSNSQKNIQGGKNNGKCTKKNTGRQHMFKYLE